MIPIAYALRESLKNGYSLKIFKDDFIAGFIVSIMALPLAMALAIAVGLPPQYGLYTAIVAGIVTPLVGGSIPQVSGPTAAFIVILVPVVAKYGLRGLIISGIMAGILLIVAGIMKLGRYINYMPYSVTTGFTSGIAVVLAVLSLNDLLGLGIKDLNGDFFHKLILIIKHVSSLNGVEATVGITSLVIMCTSKRVLPKVPPFVVGIGIATLLAYVLQSYGFELATIGSRFSYTLPDGGVGHGIPPFLPEFHIHGIGASELFALPKFLEIRALMVPSIVIAMLAGLESLLCATIADGMTRTKHHPDGELIGVGIGNILTGLASGIPATGAIARTATNIYSGARTPFASTIHALLVLVYVMFLAPLLSYIPMAALAALLMAIAIRMSHYQQFVRILQIAPRSDSIVLLACFGFTVFIDMVAGVTVGVALACFLLLRNISKLTQTQVSHLAEQHPKLKTLKLPENVMVYHIDGVLFFGTVEKALERTDRVLDYIQTLMIDLEDVPLIDITSLVAMKNWILDLQAKNKQIILCGKYSIVEKILKKLPSDAKQKVMHTETVEKAIGNIPS